MTGPPVSTGIGAGSVGWLVALGLGLGGCAPPDPAPDPPGLALARSTSPAHNPATPAGIVLGERLFHDPGLSSTGTVSCATCHDPARAFTDGRGVSVGVSGRPLKRNAPTLIGVGGADGLFWDGGARNLESLAFAPLSHPDEMGRDLSSLVPMLQADRGYRRAFEAAFDDGVTLGNVARALAQYQRALAPSDAPFDRYIRGEKGALTAVEEAGWERFQAHCAGCHVPGPFTDHAFHDIGLDTSFPEDDERLAWGRARITGDLRDLGRYKTPTLRNVARTAPYMHDGRFQTLEAVIAHYREGVQPSPALDPRLRGEPGRPGLQLTDEDAAALVAFLGALTGEEGGGAAR